MLLSISSNVTGNQKFNQKNNSLHLFAAATGYSYSCKSESLYMGSGLYLDVTQDQMQAFNLVNDQDFGKRKYPDHMKKPLAHSGGSIGACTDPS